MMDLGRQGRYVDRGVSRKNHLQNPCEGILSSATVAWVDGEPMLFGDSGPRHVEQLQIRKERPGCHDTSH